MYPAQCEYFRAASVPEALDLLGRHPDAELIAGGQGIVTDMKTGRVAPDVLIDVGGIDRLRGVVAEEETVTIGALTRHADLASSAPLRDGAPVIAAAAEHVGDRQVRNCGTIGGNIAEANHAADLPAALLAADGTVAVRGLDGERRIDGREFFRGDGQTALDERELITHVRVSRTAGASAYLKKTHPATGYAMVGVAVDLGVEDGRVSDPRVAVTGVADRATRLPSVEDALTDQPIDEDRVAASASRAREDLDDARLVDDEHASGEYRASVLPAYVERAVETAVGRTRGDA